MNEWLSMEKTLPLVRETLPFHRKFKNQNSLLFLQPFVRLRFIIIVFPRASTITQTRKYDRR